MDLVAYAQIEDIEELAKKNGIVVPRLRGYRLMRDESPVIIKLSPEEQILFEVKCAEQLCVSYPFWDPNSCCTSYDYHTDTKRKKYLRKAKPNPLNKDNIPYYDRIRWDKIHGWKRKVLKTYIHNELKKQQRQDEVFNKYAAREDILMIHARIGGNNWPSYFDQVINQPWFLEKVDDSYDSTYCDIYAKLTILE